MMAAVRSALVPRCAPRKKLTLAQVREEAREIQRYLRTKVLYSFCEPCDAYHVEVDPDHIMLPTQNRRILELYAIGYRQSEIGARDDVRLTQKAVENRMERMREKMGAQSNAHLVMLAAYFGIIQPQQHFPGIKGAHA